MRAISQVRSGDCAGASRSLRIASFLHGKSAGLYAKGTRSLEAEQHLDYISRSIDLAMSKLGSLCMVKRR